jgi:hypothetical protein
LKILLDECLLLDFRHCRGCGIRRLVDRRSGIPYQQRFAGRKISILLIRSRTNQLEDLVPLADAILRVLESIQPGQVSEAPP